MCVTYFKIIVDNKIFKDSKTFNLDLRLLNFFIKNYEMLNAKSSINIYV